MIATASPATRDARPRSDYDRDGFVVVRGLFDPTRWPPRGRKPTACSWSTSVSNRPRTSAAAGRPTSSPASARSRRSTRSSTSARFADRLAHDPRLLAVLGDLYGEPACLFKDKLIYKPPGVKGYGLHQDWIAWHGLPAQLPDRAVPFDPADRDNGCTVVYPGYHHLGTALRAGRAVPRIAGRDRGRGEGGATRAWNRATWRSSAGSRPHRSDPNCPTRWRRQLYLSYNALSDGGDQRTKHYREFHAWLQVKYAEHGKTDTYFE